MLHKYNLKDFFNFSNIFEDSKRTEQSVLINSPPLFTLRQINRSLSLLCHFKIVYMGVCLKRSDESWGGCGPKMTVSVKHTRPLLMQSGSLKLLAAVSNISMHKKL